MRNAEALEINEKINTDPATDNRLKACIGTLNALLGRDVLAKFAKTSSKGSPGFDILNRPSFSETGPGDLIADSYRTLINAVSPGNPVEIAFEGDGNIGSG